MKRTAPIAMLVAVLPGGLAAQGITVTPFGAVDGGLSGAPPLVGFSATVWSRAVGFRIGGAMDLPSTPLAPLYPHPRTDAVEAWQGDLDLVFDLGRLGLRSGNIDPRAFTGVGVHGRRQTDGSAATIPVWSYGGGASIGLTPWLAVDLEARYRMPHESDRSALPSGVGRGWDTRAGLAFGIGRGGRAARPAAPARAAPGRATIGSAPAGAAGETGAARNPGTAASATRDARAAVVARSALSTADRSVGAPYRWGGNTPAEGFDCSGFVRYVFAEQGIHLPRTARDQAGAGEWLPPRVDHLAPGDLMFYADRNGVIDHVAIYAGGGRIIHSSSTGRGVRYDDLTTGRGHYYATRMVAARRVIPDGGVFTGLR